MEDKFVIGVDYGTDSARAVIINTKNGEQIASAVAYYSRWKQGLYCDPQANRYRQHPLDYIEALEESVKGALAKSPKGTNEKVAGISFDTTGSTPVFTDERGTPLSLLPDFEENPNAMFVLWKDHTAVQEAAEINRLAAQWKPNYIQYEGGIYSSEWFWAKALHILREDKQISARAYSIVEHCDWMPSLLTGVNKVADIKRSRCAAGHKAMWSKEWGGLPPEEFFTKLDPLLAGFRSRLFDETYTADKSCGKLTREWADRLGLTTDVVVGVSAFDCHMGAVGAGITPHAFVRVIGTSTCDIMIASYKEMEGKMIRGICGQVDGSVIPGYVGLEAGQSGFGDIYAWFKRVVAWTVQQSSLTETLKQQIIDGIIPALEQEAKNLSVQETAVVATDWMNGRRTPDANQLLKGSIMDLTLSSTAPQIYKALVEATAFGSRAIVERFRDECVRIDSVIAIGGIPLKSPLVMQTLANVLNMPIKVCKTEQACALGAAMFAAAAAGIFSTVEDAQKAMQPGFEKIYNPNGAEVKVYDALYKKYLLLGKFSENGRESV